MCGYRQAKTIDARKKEAAEKAGATTVVGNRSERVVAKWPLYIKEIKTRLAGPAFSPNRLKQG